MFHLLSPAAGNKHDTTSVKNQCKILFTIHTSVPGTHECLSPVETVLEPCPENHLYKALTGNLLSMLINWYQIHSGGFKL